MTLTPIDHADIDGPEKAPFEGPLMLGARGTEGGDAAASTATTYTMEVGDTFEGSVSTGSDQDWIRIDLVAGTDYRFNVWGTDGTTSGIDDTFLYLRDSSGTVVASNDDVFPGNNLFSGIEFNADTSGTYYIDVGSFGSETGNYIVQANDAVWTPDEVATWLTEFAWGISTDIHFDVVSGDTMTVNLTGLSAGLTLARTALEAWSNVTGILFSETSGSAALTFSEAGAGIGAFAGPTSYNPVTGIINTSSITVTTGWLDNFGTTLDSYSFETYIHEIGHALGLGHGGPYDGNANYGTDDFYINDSVQMSVMSYFDDNNTFTDISDFAIISPMIADVIAMERLYGPHSAYDGNTTWGANSNVGGYLGVIFAEYFDGGSSANYNGGAVGFTVQDDGGTDLLDFSTATVNQIIDITQGGVSDINGSDGNVVIAMGTVIEHATSGSGNDNITGNSSDNILRGGAGNDTIRGGSGHDSLFGDGGADSLIGGSGNDYLGSNGSSDYFSGGSGSDTVSHYGHGSAVEIDLSDGSNNMGNTYISIENLLGSSGYSDTLSGDDDNNRLQGAGGNDRLFGGRGNDRLEGGSGDDRLEDNSGADIFDGGSGNDTASYFGHASGVSVNLGSGSNSSGDTYISIENLMGSNNAADTLRGDDDDNRLRGFAGDDRIFGERGNDTLEGGAGDDYLRDDSGADTFIGGSGDDTVSYYGRISDLRASLSSGNNNSGDSYDSIESLMGSNVGSDLLIGSSSSNRLWGFGGDDSIRGGGGNDRLEGGDGDDTLNGGSGADDFVFERNDDDDRIVDFQDGTDRIVFDISGLGFGDLTIVNVAGGARITYDPGDTIIVEGIDRTQLTSADFDFV